MHSWAKRMEPPLGGVAVFRKSIAVPQDIGDQAERLVRAINLEGCCHVDFAVMPQENRI